MRISALAWSSVVVATFAIGTLAADVSGKWKAQFTTPDGQTRETLFSFKVDGDKLTGTVSSPRGETQISEGKVSGDEISFSVLRTFREQQVKMLYKGKVSGDEIKFTVQREGSERSFEMTAKRIGS